MLQKDFFQSKLFKEILIGILGLVVLLIVFGAGIYIGNQKAGFSYHWGENYHRNFGGPRGGLLNPFSNRDFINGNGATGVILKLDSTSLTMKGKDNTERVIGLGPDTVIRRGNQDIKATDLKVDEDIVVLGAPQANGTIQAKFIRVFDPNF